jgi:hypothetical protein
VTKQQCEEVLRRLHAAFPQSRKLDADALEAWMRTMRSLPYDAALAGADRARRECEYLPSHRAFIELVEAERRRLAISSARRDEGGRVASPELARSWAERIRQNLARAKGPLAADLAAAAGRR